jgi:hypothetical protein
LNEKLTDIKTASIKKEEKGNTEKKRIQLIQKILISLFDVSTKNNIINSFMQRANVNIHSMSYHYAYPDNQRTSSIFLCATECDVIKSFRSSLNHNIMWFSFIAYTIFSRGGNLPPAFVTAFGISYREL